MDHELTRAEKAAKVLQALAPRCQFCKRYDGVDGYRVKYDMVPGTQGRFA